MVEVWVGKEGPQVWNSCDEEEELCVWEQIRAIILGYANPLEF